jgi:hypothetical protein
LGRRQLVCSPCVAFEVMEWMVAWMMLWAGCRQEFGMLF